MAIERALLILVGDHRLADGVDEVGVPLRAEPGAAGPNVLGEPLVVLQVLGDGDPAGIFLSDLAVDPLEQAPAIGQVLAAGTGEGMNVGGAVEAEAVDMIFLEPHEDVVEDILSDLAASVIGTGVSPRRMRPVVVVEVDSAAIVLGPAVELPKIEVPRAKVVVNDVEDHRDAVSVGALDELLERQRAAVGESQPKRYGRGCSPTTGLPRTGLSA